MLSRNLGLQYFFIGETFSGEVAPLPKTVATPVIFPSTGDYYYGQKITITCRTNNSTIYYTTNGDIPTENSIQYTGQIILTGTITIKAIAVRNGYVNSEISSTLFSIIPSKAIINGDLLKVIAKSLNYWLVYEFQTYPNISGQYTHYAKYYATDNNGTQDSSKIVFPGGDVCAPASMFGGSVYGNHAFNIGQEVVFTTVHGYTPADIGTELIRSDGKKFVIYGIIDEYTVLTLGQQVSASYMYITPYYIANGEHFNSSTLTASSVTGIQLYAGIKHEKTIEVVSFDNQITDITNQNGIYNGKKIIVTDSGKGVHPKSFYDFLVANKRHLSHIINNQVSPDTFFDPQQGTIIEITRSSHIYSIYPNGWIKFEDRYESVASIGGVDAPEIWVEAITDRQPNPSWILLPKALKTLDSHGLINPNREIYDAINHSTQDEQIYERSYNPTYPSHAVIDDEFGMTGKKQFLDRCAIMDDNLYGSFNGYILDCPDNNHETRWMKDYNFGDGMCKVQAQANKVMINSTISGTKNTQTIVSFKKLLTNLYPDIFTLYEYFEQEDGSVYMWIDVHKTLPEGYKIPFPEIYIGYDCEILEKTNSFNITESDISRILESGFSAEYQYDENDSPHGFISLKLTPHIEHALDEDALIFIDKLSQIPNSDRQNIIDTVFKKFKKYGLFTRGEASWLAGLNDVDSRINLFSNNYTLTPLAGGAPTFVADRGWTGSGTKGFSTGYNPYQDLLKYKHNSGSFVFYVRSAPANSTSLPLGYYDSGASCVIGIRPDGASSHKILAYAHETSYSASDNQTTAIGQGLYGITIHNGTMYLYHNGILINKVFDRTNRNFASKVITLLYDTVMGSFTGELSMAWIGEELTSTQHANMYLIIQEYMTSIGGQV